MDFKHEDNRIYLNNSEGKMVSEVTFPDVGNQIVDIDHTFVDESLRGQGVAAKIMKETADTLRKQGKKATLTCTYAQAWFKRNKDYDDVLSK